MSEIREPLDTAIKTMKYSKKHFISPLEKENKRLSDRLALLEKLVGEGKEAAQSMIDWIEATKEPHLIDTDDNPGQFLRDWLQKLSFSIQKKGGV